MKLDTVTLLFALSILGFSLSAVFLLCRRYLLPLRQLLLWGSGMACYSAGILLLALRLHLPLLMSAVLANLLLMLYYGLLWWGVSLHRGRQPRLKASAAVFLLFIAIHAWFLYVQPDMAIRTILQRFFWALFLIMTIRELLDNGNNRLTRMEKMLCSALGTDLLFRVAILLVQAQSLSYKEPVHSSLIVAASSSMSFFTLSFIGMALILVTLEKIIAERTTAEAESNSAKKHLETSYYAMTDMVCLLDLNGKIIIHNRAMEKFLGLSGNKIDGYFCYELMHGTEKHIDNCPFERMLHSKQRESLLLELNGKWLEVSVDPVLDDNRQIMAAVHLIKDVTEHKNLVSELEKSRDKLEETVQERTHQLLKSNQLLEETGQLARVGGWELDPFARQIIWSNVVRQIHEVGPEYMPNINEAINFYAPEAVPAITRAVKEAMEDGKSFDLELPLITAKGNHIWVRAIGKPVFEQGQMTKISGIFQDITVQKNTIEELRIHREHLEELVVNRTAELERQLSILEATHNELYIFDINDWHFDYVNRSALKNLGYTPVEIAKLTPLDLKPSINRDSFEHLIAPLLSGEKLLIHFETFHRRKDGSEYPVEVYLQTVEARGSSSNSSNKYFLAVIHDITERINSQELLKQKNAETEQFIYTVSHDLRSPLVTIRTFLGYLKDDLNNTEQAGQDLQFIQGAADKMEEMLQELLELSRLGFKESRISATSFRQLAEEAAATLAGQTAENKITVLITDEDIPLRGDRQRLSQIWQNLLENAVKYMGGNSDPKVTISAEKIGDETVFFVRDNGIGIAPENMDRVFRIFEKLGHKSSGVGMGLSIVKRIVELNNGRIWVESEGPGQGSCFRFTLPDAVAAAQTEQGTEGGSHDS